MNFMYLRTDVLLIFIYYNESMVKLLGVEVMSIFQGMYYIYGVLSAAKHNKTTTFKLRLLKATYISLRKSITNFSRLMLNDSTPTLPK